MAARVCGSCWLSLPITHADCPVCGQTTVVDHNLAPPSDVDWKARVAQLLEVRAEELDSLGEWGSMRMNRTRRLVEAGVPFELAVEAAGWMSGETASFAVDVHEVEKLVADGCKPVLAVKIADTRDEVPAVA